MKALIILTPLTKNGCVDYHLAICEFYGSFFGFSIEISFIGKSISPINSEFCLPSACSAIRDFAEISISIWIDKGVFKEGIKRVNNESSCNRRN